jgi:selenide,water dikinase
VAERSGAHLVLAAADLPVLPGVLAAAEAGARTGGDPRNRAYVAGHATLACGDAHAAVAFDPQTSGGLLAAVAPAAVDALADAGFVPIGRVEAGPPGVTLGA